MSDWHPRHIDFTSQNLVCLPERGAIDKSRHRFLSSCRSVTDTSPIRGTDTGLDAFQGLYLLIRLHTGILPVCLAPRKRWYRQKAGTGTRTVRPRSAVSDRAITERVAFRVDGHVVVPTNVLDERVTSGHDGQARRTIR